MIMPTDLLQAAVCARVMGSRGEIHDAAYRGDLLLVEDFSTLSLSGKPRSREDFMVPYDNTRVNEYGEVVPPPRLDVLGNGRLKVPPTPLAFAIAGSSQAETFASFAAVVTFLIKAKADVGWKSNYAADRICDLEHAAYACPSGPIMSALLAASTFTDEYKPVLLRTLLRIAVYRGHIDPIKVLLSHKADPIQVDEIRTKPYLSFASNSKAVHLETIASLIEANTNRYQWYRAGSFPSVSRKQTNSIGPVGLLSALAEDVATADSSLTSHARCYYEKYLADFL